MSNEVFLNPSLGIDTLFPTLDDESFLQFLKEYYKWLQSTKITLSSVTGTPIQGEIVIGATSNARGLVKFLNDTLTETIVLITTDTPFEIGETLNFQTSGATAIISSYKDNVLRESARIQKNRNQKQSGEEYLKLLKDELNRGYPSTSEAERREIFAKIRDLYKSKSTEEAYRFLFKAFFDENIEIRFPGDDILRVSDGKFEKTSLIRVVPTNTNAFPVGGIFDFLNKTIRGQTSGAVGTVVNISISFLGGIQYAEFNLKLVSGEFEAGETVADVLQPRLSTEVFGIIGDIQINDGGSGYSVGDAITITGDGAEATAEVSSISAGPINKILINVPGYGYRLNTRAAVDNTDTGGDNLEISVTSIANTYTVTDGANTYTVGDTSKIQIVSRGSGYQRTPTITLVDSTIRSLGLLSERLITIANSGTDYAVGEILTFTGGAGTNAAGEVASVGNTEPYGEENILFEDDFVLLQEQEVNGLHSAIKSEDWGNLGSILRIELTNLGSGYTSNNLPTLTLESANTVSGANATFTVNGIQGASANVTVDIANNSVGIGSIRQIDIRNPGINFSSANIDATTQGDGNANLEAVISGLNVNRGFFTNDDGKISFKIIQDSFFYQDFSYVIRSGLIIDAYKELVKETVHPAGLEFFGEIVITSIIALRADFRSQIDQTPRPLALRSFLSLYPAGINIPYAGSIREVEITPAVIDQALIGVNDLSIREVEITPAVIDEFAEFSREIVNKLYLFIDVALFPTFSDVQTGTIPTIPTELDYVLAGMSGVIDTHREYNIEIAPIRMEQPLAVRDFNIREIEITPKLDLVIDVSRVKTFDQFADQFGEYSISFFAETLISTYSANTFLDFSGLDIEQIFRKRIDTQGLEIDIELVSTDLKAQVVDSTSFGTEQEVPLFVSVPLIDTQIAELVNRLELYIDASAQIVFNDIQVVETEISDIVVKVQVGKVTTTVDTGREYRIHLTPERLDQAISVRGFNVRDIEIIKEIELDAQTTAEYEIDLFSKADTTTYYLDQLIEDFASEQISEYANFKFTDLITIPLAAPGFKPTEYTLRIELPLVTVAANIQPFRIFVDRLRLPSLGLGTSVIDATVNFDGTSYEIETRPQFVQFAPNVIPQTTGRLKRLTYILPPVVATINNIYEVIKIQKEIDVASTILTSINYKVESPLIDQALVGVLDFNIREIEITPYLDMRMAFYSEIYTMTNRVHTTEIEIQSEIDVAPIPRMKLEIDVPPGFTAPFKGVYADDQLLFYSDDEISSITNDTFLDNGKLYRYQSLSRVDFDYEIEIVPQTIDARMRFYSEILTMTNREMTVELEVFSKINIAAITPQEVVINYVIAPDAIDVGNSVRDFNIREIEIQLLIDSRMRFYSEILTMTNREMTVEIDVIAETVNVGASTTRIVTFNIPRYGEAQIQLFASNTIAEFSGITSDSDEFEADSTDITADEFAIGFSTPLNITGTRQVPSSFYKIDILPSKDVVALFVPIEDRLIGMEKDVVLYADLRMSFYSEILAMTNRVHTTEIEIFSFTDVASIAPQEVVVNFGIKPIKIDVSGEVSDFNIREIEISPISIDLRMSFYSEILAMTNRVHTTEIDIFSFADISSQNFYREIELEVETLQDVSSDFSINLVPWGDKQILFAENTQLQALAEIQFNNEYANLNTSKNVLADGTVNFEDPYFAGLRIRSISGIEIDNYSANTFNDLSGSKVAVFGTNTNFTTDFANGGTILTQFEKFFVTSVANDTYLEINVNPEENYNDVSVYREYFV